MLKMRKLTSIMIISGTMLISGGITGCFTQKPNSEETGKLEEARAAAESAERKLSELRQERIRLEQEVQNKSSSELPAEE